jgi:hypothetical protein
MRARTSIVRAMRVAAALLVGLGLAWLPIGTARPESEVPASPPAFFVIGPQTAGLALGYAHGVSAIASGQFDSQDLRALVVLPHWQMDLTRRPIEPAWYKGSLAIRLEPTFMASFRPRSGYAIGLDILLRYRLLSWGRIVPYLELGAGPAYIDLNVIDQIDGFAFIPTAGAGVTWRAWERVSLDLGVRLQHISNAYTRLPNGGIDSVQVLLGAAYHFDHFD